MAVAQTVVLREVDSTKEEFSEGCFFGILCQPDFQWTN